MTPLENFLIVAVAAGIGSYLGAYLKKKGENLATQEDIKQANDGNESD